MKNHADGIASVDFFVAPTAAFKLLFGLAILRHNRRRLVHIAVTTRPTADWIAHQISKAFLWETAAEISHSGSGWRLWKGVQATAENDGYTRSPDGSRSPWQNAHVERLIGTIRRECLGHMIIFSEAHLCRVLKAYADYYNGVRTHLSLCKDAPYPREIRRDGRIRSVPHLGGLHYSLVRI